MRIRSLATLALAASFLPAVPVAQAPVAPTAPAAAAPAPATPSASSDAAPATQADVRALAEEVRRLKLEMSVPDVIQFGTYAGQGAGASKTHFAPKGLSIGGYGELVYVNYADDRADYAEVLRLVLYVGYRFTDRIVFNSEIEFEHGASEIAIEFAYLDFTILDELKVRAGNVLVPVGFVNENHEPIFFYGVFRPKVDRSLIPTTWNQNGVGIYGDFGPVRYKAYFLTGLDAFGPEPLQASSWIRNARTGASGPGRTFAGVAQRAADVGPATFGASFYGGDAGQGATTATGERISPTVLLGEVHALVAWKGLQARGLAAWGSLGDAGLVSAALGLSGAQVIGSEAWGAYVEVGYDVLTLLGSSMSLSPFLRFEALNTQAGVPAGGVQDPALNQRVLTAGLDFKPIPQVVVKADWQQTSSDAPGNLQQWDLGLGFVF